jgi:CRP/FNR family transcriptional regulator
MERQRTSGQPGRTMTMRAQCPDAGIPSRGTLWSTLEEICILLHSPTTSLASDKTLFQHVQFKTGQRIHRVGQVFDTLYVVNAGFLKTATVDDSGTERVLGFPMKGDMIGLDGIHFHHHASETIALTECDLILLPFARLTGLGRANPDVENLMYRMMSRELAFRQEIINTLGTLSAEARVARFLVSLTDRFVELGYSGKLFNLRMTRQEIGNFLGLTMETVSRTLSAFNEMGLITVQQRCVGINEPEALRALCRPPPAWPLAPGRTRPVQTLRRSATGSLPKSSVNR